MIFVTLAHQLHFRCVCVWVHYFMPARICVLQKAHARACILREHMLAVIDELWKYYSHRGAEWIIASRAGIGVPMVAAGCAGPRNAKSARACACVLEPQCDSRARLRASRLCHAYGTEIHSSSETMINYCRSKMRQRDTSESLCLCVCVSCFG